MSETSLEKIKKKMLEIKIIGGNSNNITLKDLNEIINLLKNHEPSQEIEKILKKFYQDNRNHIFYGFALAIFFFLKKENGDSYLVNFYNQLAKIGKNSILDLISLEILKIYESEFVLNYLSNHYERSDKKEELIEIWKRLLQKNSNNVDLILKIAEKYTKSNPQESINYFQLALLKESDNRNYSNALNIWKKIIDLHFENYDLIIQLSRKFIDGLDQDNKSSLFVYLLKNLDKHFEKNHSYFIKVLKLALENGVLLRNQFNKLIQSYRMKYKHHRNFEMIVSLSGMNSLYKNSNYLTTTKIIEIIKEFEKYIIFDEGKFVNHRSFGIGLIKQIKTAPRNVKANDLKLLLDFKRRRNHEMSFRIAINSLVVLYSNHLEALAVFNPEKLNEMKKDQLVLLENVLKTLSPPVTPKEITELVVSKTKMFSKEEWKREWGEIKKKILNGNEFEITSKGVKFKELSVSLENNTLNFLNGSHGIKEKIKNLDFYYNNQGEVDDKVDKQILNILITWANSAKQGNLAMATFLYYLKNNLNKNIDVNASEFFKAKFKQKNLMEEFNFLPSSSLKENFIHLWYDNFESSFFSDLVDFWLLGDGNKEIVFDFLANKNQSLLLKLFELVDYDYLKYKEAYFSLVKLFLRDNNSVLKNGIGEVLLKLLKINFDLHKNISIEKKLVFSKKLYNLIYNYLFKDDLLFRLLKEKDLVSPSEKKLIFAELEKQTFLENYLKVEIRTLNENLKK